jgi:hypothetical protein
LLGAQVVPHIEPTWTEIRAANRAALDAILLTLASWPVVYGSPAYHALPAGHPHRAIAMRRAAEAWRSYWDPAAVAARRADIADQTDRRAAARIKALSADLSAATDWTRAATGPTHAQLRRRRYPWLHDPDWQPPSTPDPDALTRWVVTGSSIPCSDTRKDDAA